MSWEELLIYEKKLNKWWRVITADGDSATLMKKVVSLDYGSVDMIVKKKFVVKIVACQIISGDGNKSWKIIEDGYMLYVMNIDGKITKELIDVWLLFIDL